MTRGSSAKTRGTSSGQRVCAPTQTTSLTKLRSVNGVTVVTADNHTGCLVKFQQGQADAITGDDTVLAGLSLPRIRMPWSTSRPSPTSALWPGVNLRQRSFVRYINAVPAQVRSDGEWKRSIEYLVSPALRQVPNPTRTTAADESRPRLDDRTSGVLPARAPGRLGVPVTVRGAALYLCSDPRPGGSTVTRRKQPRRDRPAALNRSESDPTATFSPHDMTVLDGVVEGDLRTAHAAAADHLLIPGGRRARSRPRSSTPIQPARRDPGVADALKAPGAAEGAAVSLPEACRVSPDAMTSSLALAWRWKSQRPRHRHPGHRRSGEGIERIRDQLT